jgi:hypothetical protein
MGSNWYGRSLVDIGITYLNATAPPPPRLRAFITGEAKQGVTLTGSVA